MRGENRTEMQMHLNYECETNFRFGSLMFNTQPLIQKTLTKKKQFCWKKSVSQYFIGDCDSIHSSYFAFQILFLFYKNLYVLMMSQNKPDYCLLLSIEIPRIDIFNIIGDEIHKYFRFRLIKTLSCFIKWESNNK